MQAWFCKHWGTVFPGYTYFFFLFQYIGLTAFSICIFYVCKDGKEQLGPAS